MKLSFRHLFFSLAFVIGLFAIMVLAKTVLIPLSMALLTSFILFPAVKKLESYGLGRLLSSFLILFGLLLCISAGILFFSNEIINLVDHIHDFSGKILNALSDVVVFLNTNVNFIEDLNRDDLVERAKAWLKESSGSLLSNTFSNTAAVFTGLVSTIIFTFLILIYRTGLTSAMVAFGADENKEKIFRMLKNIQRVGKKYLSGMFLLILILGLANSAGLWIIGIGSPFLFGFLAALLSIVPFIGTTIGAIIPVLYAFMSTDALWKPIAVIFLFWGIQLIESNFLNPKIVGSSLHVNALVAILSLLVGAAVWGIAGMVLFLPFTAILKVLCQEYKQLKPIAMLISDDISHTKGTKAIKWVKKIKGWFGK